MYSIYILQQDRLDREAKMSSNPINVLELASSMPVPNVQELARSGEIPKRYLRPEAEANQAATVDDDELPAIDLKKLLSPELNNEEEVSRLGFACREWGFFQLINHGIPEEVIEKMKDDIKKFFELPLREKEEIKQLPGHIEGYGQLFVHSEEQRLDWADVVVLIIQPSQNRNMRFWPTNPTTFRANLDAYTTKIGEVANCLYKCMTKDLGIDAQDMLNLFSDQIQSVRINYYSPCKQANKVLGLSPHSDGTALTVLLQVNDVHGLQIKKNDKWFFVKPTPGALIINIGDMIEVMTNGKYKSIEHRAIINTEDERLSIATFNAPSNDTILRPFPELVDCDGELYKTISVNEYAKKYLSEKLNGKSALESMKLRK